MKKYQDFVLESVIEKYYEGKLNKNKCIELLDFFNESYVIPEPIYKINMDKWGPGHPLWITGSSGDGKSTLAKEYCNKFSNTALVTLDWLLIRLRYPKEKYFRKVVNNPKTQEKDFIIVRFMNEHPEIPYELGLGQYNHYDEVNYWYNTFFDWLLKEAKTTYSKYNIIVEGCDIALYGNPKVFAREPLIIMGTSRMQGKIRRIKRDIETSTDHDMSLLEAIKREMKRDYVKDINKSKDNFKKMIKLLQR